MTYGNGEYNKHGLYRSRNGLIFGVCRGVADYLDVSVFWTRAIAVAALIFGFFIPTVLVYFGAALVMKPEPVVPLKTEDEEEFYNSLTSSRKMALHRLKRTFDNLERRVQRMESVVTARDFDWDNRYNGG